MMLPLPDANDQEFTHTPAQGYRRSPEGAEKAWEQACRQAWRALALVVKAKLEAIEAGIASFEDEFLAYTVLPGGTTVGEQVAPAIEEAYTTGRVQPLLALGSG